MQYVYLQLFCGSIVGIVDFCGSISISFYGGTGAVVDAGRLYVPRTLGTVTLICCVIDTGGDEIVPAILLLSNGGNTSSFMFLGNTLLILPVL